MQEEVENRTLTLVVNGTKFTERLFKAAICKYLAHRKPYFGHEGGIALWEDSNRVFQLHRLSRHFRANGGPCGYLDFRGFRLGITTFRGGAKSLSEFFSIGVCDIACTRIVAQQCVYNSDVQA